MIVFCCLRAGTKWLLGKQVAYFNVNFLTSVTVRHRLYQAITGITSGLMLPLTTADLLAHAIVGSRP